MAEVEECMENVNTECEFEEISITTINKYSVVNLNKDCSAVLEELCTRVEMLVEDIDDKQSCGVRSNVREKQQNSEKNAHANLSFSESNLLNETVSIVCNEVLSHSTAEDSFDVTEAYSQLQNSDSCELVENALITDTTRIQVNFSVTPVQVTGSWRNFEESCGNFLKGCKWSPDGSCILTCSDDNTFRLFNLPIELYSDFESTDVLPEISSVLDMREGETIYDYSWYPKMSSYDPHTCCFISSSRDHPLHLWDAFTGELRCSYRSYSHMDEIVSPHCVAFNLDGSKIYCGFNKMVRVFDTARPGRQCQQRPTVSKKQGQFGIISCIAVSPENNGLYACASFSKTVGIYGEPKGKLMSLMEGHQGGVTHLLFSQDGYRLYSGGRKDNEIICWEMRYPGAVLHKLQRSVKTNQRVYFDIDSSGRYVVSGNHDGTVSVWDTCISENDNILPCHMTYVAHDDCVNGINFHPSLSLLATASGQRTFLMKDEEEITNSDNSLRLWKLNCNRRVNS